MIILTAKKAVVKIAVFCSVCISLTRPGQRYPHPYRGALEDAEREEQTGKEPERERSSEPGWPLR